MSEEKLSEAHCIRILADLSVTSPHEAWHALLGTGLRADDFAHCAAAWFRLSELLKVGAACTVQTLQSPALSKAEVAWLLGSEETEAYASTLVKHAATVGERSTRRRLVELSQRLYDEATDETATIATTLADLWKRMLTIGRADKTADIESRVDEAAASMADRDAEKVLPTGFPTLDRVIGGWQATLNILASMPGVGKSAFIAGSVRGMALQGIKVGVICLEDNAEWLVWRFLAEDAGASQWVLRFRDPSKFNVTQDQIQTAINRAKLLAPNVIVNDERRRRVEDVVLVARQMVIRHECRAIFIDHLHELDFSQARHGSMADSLDDALSQIRSVALDLKVPVILAAHVKRNNLEADDMPTLTDMKGSSGIEGKARVLLGLARANDSDVLKVGILKATTGQAGTVLELPFHSRSALVVPEPLGSREQRTPYADDTE